MGASASPTALAPLRGQAAARLEQSRSSTGAGRLFICGDIHGCIDQLRQALHDVGFRKVRDRLIALGDLVDRGPASAEVVRLLDEPWFDSIMGNHEELMLGALDGEADMLGCHLMNGGGWFAALSDDEREALGKRVRKLPYAMTVRTPSGRSIGLVHADFPGTDWPDFIAKMETPQVRDYAIWSRERIGDAKHGDIAPATGVDHVYFGHTPIKEPVTRQNMTWIDTGCFATGRLTVVELT